MGLLHRTLVRSRPVRRRITPRRFKETFVAEALAARSSPTYVEIGVRWGESFRLAHAARKVAIDPLQTEEMRHLHPHEVFFEMTSDEFFAGPASKLFAERGVDVALVDGLHEFRQALRDVLNLERFMSNDGVIFVDDCNPKTAERAGEAPRRGAWNGDVWKVIRYLRDQRADLRVFTIEADQGLGVVSGFGRTPGWPDDETVERYKRLDFESLRRSRREELRLVRPRPLHELLSTTTV